MATVVATEFEDLVSLGLEATIGDDPALELVARGVPMSELHQAVETHSPDVALLNFAALRGPEDVLELLQDGSTNAEIADRLKIGVETVRTHARSIYRKLGVPSRRELARVARREPMLVDEARRPLTRA